MKKYNNVYSYQRLYEYDENKRKVTHTNTNLYSIKNGRGYKTKMYVDDLPEHYCDVQRYMGNHNVVKSTDIKSLHYTWVKENHFMKDSVLRVSYTGEISKKPFVIKDGDKEIKTCFSDYSNVDVMIFGSEILKFLSYVKKYSNYDISEIKSEFVKQCEWLKENEPCFAPDTDDFENWFDNKINYN